MPCYELSGQAVELRVLETGQFTRVGGEELIFSDARIVSATNKNIQQLVDEGVFRDDLYYRLNIVPVHVPALRERRNDIPLLVEHFLNHFYKRHNRPPRQVADDAMHVLTSAAWPGNVRQLRNVMERLVITVTDEVITAECLPAELQMASRPATGNARPLAEVTEAAEKDAIEAALAALNCHREETAKALGISIRTLHYKMSRYDLH